MKNILLGQTKKNVVKRTTQMMPPLPKITKMMYTAVVTTLEKEEPLTMVRPRTIKPQPPFYINMGKYQR